MANPTIVPVDIVSASGLGGLPTADAADAADNSAFTQGTSKVQVAGFIVDETASTTPSENNAGAARIDSKRAQVAVIEDGATRGRKMTVGAAGDAQVSLVNPLQGENSTFARLFGGAMSSYTAVSATGQVGAVGPRVLYAVVCITAGTIVAYDNTSAAGQVIFPSRAMAAGETALVAGGIGLLTVNGVYVTVTGGTYIFVQL